MAIETVKVAIGSATAKAGEGEEAEVVKKEGVAGESEAEVEGGKAKEGEAALDPKALTEKPKEGEAGAVKTEEQLEVEKAVGFDLTPFSEEYATNGKLSDESYAAIEAKGFTRATVDTYIAGLQAQVDARNTALASVVGGPENYNAVIKWGVGALTEAEKQEAVKVLSGKDQSAAQTFLMGLNARFEKENGRAAKKTSGGGEPAGEALFKSRAEQAAAMRDPRYTNDRKYRDEVMKKSIRSFGAKTAKKRTKRTAQKAARKTTHRARAKGKR